MATQYSPLIGQDLHTSTWFAFLSATRWFGVWLDWIVVLYVAVVVYR